MRPCLSCGAAGCYHEEEEALRYVCLYVVYHHETYRNDFCLSSVFEACLFHVPSSWRCCCFDHVNILIKLFCWCCCSCRAQDRACLKFKLPTDMLHYPEEDYADDEELVSSSSPAATMIKSASALGLATQVINPGSIFSQDLWMQRICTSYFKDHACQYDDSSSWCWCCCRGKDWARRNLHNSFELRPGISTKQWRHQNVRLLYFRPSFYRPELIWFASGSDDLV